ncbi:MULTISPECIES: nitroreductase family protein [Metabacillus]|uniref:NAD(P)H nitroreductase n=1 Tax=Metabacillus indicus TaxID=246786 RepID=A0A084H133_METID|nr:MULTISPECIES: nitroreductase family protein [Metabacillus]KEZ50434.1 NAD(P)H nitroreductase [Metabacillus indicus LMG 22858]KEZ53295.1 NAD(P)H nitroreductase [Metabacillus indicus]
MTAATTESILSIMSERSSVRKYDPSVKISKEELKEILELTGKAPSAWNLQHWKFMVFHSDESKERLLPIAYNQSQITESSAVVAILGDLEANKNTDKVYNPLVSAGFMKEEIKDTLAGQIHGAYQNPVFARDAAFSNASLAAMQLMLTAKAKGYDTCAIGGFNASQLSETFKIENRYIPVMLITIGKAAKPAHQSSRISIDELSTFL